MLAYEARRLVCDIEINAGCPGSFNFLVDGAGDDITWCERASRVDFFSEILALGISQNPALAADRLTYQKRPRLWSGGRRVVETSGMELDELHVRHGCSRTPAERDAVTGRGVGVRGVEINFSAATGREHYAVGAKHRDLASFSLEHVGTEHAVVGNRPQPSGGDKVDHEMVFE